jgi:hypothetical protein
MLGAELDIEFTGPLPRAIKGEVSDGMERWLLGMAGQLEFNPESMDIVDFDQFNRTTAVHRGVPAKSLKTEDEVKDTRKLRAEAQAEAEEIEKLRLSGEAAKAGGEGMSAVQEAGGNLEAVQ